MMASEQLCKYLKITDLYALNGEIVQYVNSISIKLLPEVLVSIGLVLENLGYMSRSDTKTGGAGV